MTDPRSNGVGFTSDFATLDQGSVAGCQCIPANDQIMGIFRISPEPKLFISPKQYKKYKSNIVLDYPIVKC